MVTRRSSLTTLKTTQAKKKGGKTQAKKKVDEKEEGETQARQKEDENGEVCSKKISQQFFHDGYNNRMILILQPTGERASDNKKTEKGCLLHAAIMKTYPSAAYDTFVKNGMIPVYVISEEDLKRKMSTTSQSKPSEVEPEEDDEDVS